MRAPLALAAVLLATPAQAERLTCQSVDVILRIDTHQGGCIINGRDARLERAAPLTCKLALPTPRTLTVLDDLRFTYEETRTGRISRGTCVRQL